MVPGRISLTVTPVPAMSAAIPSLHPHMAHLEAEYAASAVTPQRPAMLATITTTPDARSSMGGMRASVMAVEDRKLMRMMRSMSWAVMLGIVLRMGTPALLTRMSMAPKASQASRASWAAASG